MNNIFTHSSDVFITPLSTEQWIYISKFCIFFLCQAYIGLRKWVTFINMLRELSSDNASALDYYILHHLHSPPNETVKNNKPDNAISSFK